MASVVPRLKEVFDSWPFQRELTETCFELRPRYYQVRGARGVVNGGDPGARQVPGRWQAGGRQEAGRRAAWHASNPKMELADVGMHNGAAGLPSSPCQRPGEA